MRSKSEKYLTDELIKAYSWEYCFHFFTLFQSMLLMVSSFKFLIIYQSEYLPDTLPALLIIWIFWKSLDPKILYSTESLLFGCFWLLWFVIIITVILNGSTLVCILWIVNTVSGIFWISEVFIFIWFTIYWTDIFIVKHIIVKHTFIVK